MSQHALSTQFRIFLFQITLLDLQSNLSSKSKIFVHKRAMFCLWKAYRSDLDYYHLRTIWKLIWLNLDLHLKCVQEIFCLYIDVLGLYQHSLPISLNFVFTVSWTYFLKAVHSLQLVLLLTLLPITIFLSFFIHLLWSY